MTSRKFSCWLIGSESLLAECGDILLRAGHDVRGVVTSSGRIADWARLRKLPLVDPGDGGSSADHVGFERELALRPFDYLFAITHLSILPDSILRLPTRRAINFHDGPLPDYAGLNAPAWALMNGERRYGITWHILTSEVDGGDILEQTLFDVAPDETALSLNTRCFEAAIDSFGKLIQDLALERIKPAPQDRRRRRNFERHRRPPAACAIDWTRPAEEIDALVRALDFGRYPNTLGLPKIHGGQRVFAVTRAQALDVEPARNEGAGEAARAPGTVLAADDEAILVATGRGAIALSGFSDLRGRAVAPAEIARRLDLHPGAVLERLSPENAERLTELDRRMSRAERSWVRRLSQSDPITLPCPVAPTVQTARVRAAALPIPVPAELSGRFRGHAFPAVILAAFAGYLARLARRPTFDIGYRDLALRRESKGFDSWIGSRVPLRVEVRAEEDMAALLERVTPAIAEVQRRGPWLRDCLARYPELHALRTSTDGQLLPVAVDCSERFEAPALPTGAECTIEIVEGAGECRCVYDAERISAAQAASIQRGFSAFLAGLAIRPELSIGEHTLVAADERERQLAEWNRTGRPHRRDVCVHELFAEQARRTPDRVAVVCQGESLTYAELDARANLLAAELSSLGVHAGHLVGISVERSLDLIVSVLGTLKAGGAYVPLDPAFPADRLAFMIEDARLAVIVTQHHLASALSANAASGAIGSPGARLLEIDSEWPRIAAGKPASGSGTARPEDLAYVIYTSGSTGRPKGVLVEHRNVASFFAAMDEHVPAGRRGEPGPPGVWLAVTSLSFDISVLELLWTLTRGFEVVLHSNQPRGKASAPPRGMEFSLFYFSSDEGNARDEGYRLLLEGARFADENGFRAVWTPERHFHAFGGLYPNPAVTGAAIAAITRRVEIRAGSVVLPLHHPIRVAEEWALVDNLSGGRVAISFASGWQPDDFVLAPANRKNAKEVMLRDIEVVRRLWRGETLPFPGADGATVEVNTLPRPVQPELRVWLTSAGNVETYEAAGRMGANVLTHLLGQSVDQLAPKIAAYRTARAAAGFDPATGIVSLMLHTFVGEDEERVRETVREPLERYLASSLSLLKQHAWAFPAFRRPNGAAPGEEDDKGDGLDLAHLDAEERQALLAHARERYYETSGLFGTPRRCREMVERLQRIGVDEIACLIDFGVPAADVLASLPLLDRIRRQAQEWKPTPSAPADSSLAAEILERGVTHLQCTPSMARILCSDPETRSALGRVKNVFVGGEALPADLARELAAATGGAVTNMYGPTETTIWSSTFAAVSGDATPHGRAVAAPEPSSLGADAAHDPDVTAQGKMLQGVVSTQVPQGTVPIGRPIANTRFYVLDEGLHPLPIGASGELFIGGDGVVRGYLRRPELDAERFVDDPFAGVPGARMYRTGDLVRYRSDGVVEFLGRTDFQIKVRGHRIEPGEIEALLARDPSVVEAVVVAREDTPGDQRLIAYVVPRGALPDAAHLRELLKRELPEYMVPAQFVFLDRIPRTPNAKIDRRALPVPAAAVRPAAQSFVPASDLENRLARLWQETLGLDRVGVEDNFFDLGGHSLLIVRIHRRMGELTTRPVSLTDLFRFPTIRSLARALTTDGTPGVLEEASLRGQRRRRSLQRRRQKAVEG